LVLKISLLECCGCVTFVEFLCGIVRDVNRRSALVELLPDVRLEFLPLLRAWGRDRNIKKGDTRQ
jgi:hypothetical protein